MNLREFTDKLIANGFLSGAELDTIYTKMRDEKREFWDVVYDYDHIERDFVLLVCDYYGIKPYFYSSENKPDTDATGLITADFAYRNMVVSVRTEEAVAYVALANPANLSALEDLELLLPFRIEPMYSSWTDIKLMLDVCYGKTHRDSMTDLFLGEDRANSIIKRDDGIKDAPAVRLIDSIIDMAILKNASDIHIEPGKEIIVIRFRIDGRLIEYERISVLMHQALVSRLKVMGNMDISKKSVPQDGRFKDIRRDMKIDFRLNSVPALYGEKIAIRLLYEKTILMDKFDLGFSKTDLKTLEKLFRSAHGAVLLTGPTGSGKSTTMSAFLQELNAPDINIITIEDPVENVILGINHININPAVDFTFPNAFNAILRQDPDIIMVGEIREQATAQLAINSALTGHLVLSTLHTNDAVSAIYRLIDMGVSDYLVYAAIRGVVSQRLVRRLCVCKKQVELGKANAFICGLPSDTLIYEAAGCPLCERTGYKGRFAIYEILVVNDTLLRLFSEKKTYNQIKTHLLQEGMKTLWDCGMENVQNGNTSFAEFTKAVLI